MADEKYTFEQARVRLEEIAVEVRKKDTSLERSLDLLEEGVRLANICTELVDHADFEDTVTAPAVTDDETGGSATSGADPAVDGEAVAEAVDEGFDESDDQLEEPTDAVGDD